METTTDSAIQLETWWDDFARSLRRRGRSERTGRVYRQSFDYFWRFAQGQGVEAPEDVTAGLINAWTEHEQAIVSPSTVALRYRNLRPFFAWWSREAEQPNPFEASDVPSPGAEEPPPTIDLADVRALLKACEGRGFAERRDTAIIYVLFDTGCRLGELVGLKLTDWDRRNDFLRLDGKTGPRVVDLSAATGDALSRYVRARSHHRDASRDALWLGTKGELTARGVEGLLARRCAQAGLPRINPHRFRHTFAHEFRAEGGSEGDLMYLAGWKSTAMAHRYGLSAAAQRAREAHRRLGIADKL